MTAATASAWTTVTWLLLSNQRHHSLFSYCLKCCCRKAQENTQNTYCPTWALSAILDLTESGFCPLRGVRGSHCISVPNVNNIGLLVINDSTFSPCTFFSGRNRSPNFSEMWLKTSYSTKCTCKPINTVRAINSCLLSDFNISLKWDACNSKLMIAVIPFWRSDETVSKQLTSSTGMLSFALLLISDRGSFVVFDAPTSRHLRSKSTSGGSRLVWHVFGIINRRS